MYAEKHVARRSHSGRARNSGLCAVQNSYVSAQRKQSLSSVIGAAQYDRSTVQFIVMK